jgi:hypothetical protein
LVVSLLFLCTTSRDSRAGESAEVLNPSSWIQQVRISPSGDWIIAYVVYGEGHGILVQRTATGEVASVFATTIPFRRVDWIDRDTIIADLVDGYRRRTMVVTFRASAQGLEFDTDWISSFGWLVDPLPLVDDEVIWVVDHGNRQALHRVGVEKLIDYGQRGGRRRLVGTRLALVEGEIERWIVDRSGRPRAIQRRDEDGYTILVRGKGDSQFHEIHSSKDRDDDSMIDLMSLSRDQHQIIVRA